MKPLPNPPPGGRAFYIRNAPTPSPLGEGWVRGIKSIKGESLPRFGGGWVRGIINLKGRLG